VSETPDLAARLYRIGLPEAIPVVAHGNRRVLVTLTSRGALRVHAGYARAPDEVLAAIVRWARPRTRRADRLAAQRLLTGFAVHDHLAPRPPARRADSLVIRPGDEPVLERLRALHAELNQRHFGGALGQVTLALSERMRRRLGEFRPAAAPGERHGIALGRRHLARDGWRRVTETLLHEMVHQWQAETGRPLGHRSDFRMKCAAVGIEGRAVSRLRDDFRQYLWGRS
jgi:hypothetical protein